MLDGTDRRAADAAADTVILEVVWIGTLALSIGTLDPGSEMRAQFAMFLDFRDGRIVRQRNYGRIGGRPSSSDEGTVQTPPGGFTSGGGR